MLTSKLAFITGAASGIGKATCFKFAQEGAKLIAADINYEEAKAVEKKIGSEDCTAFKLDVTNASDVQSVLKNAVDKYGQPPSIVVTCAGITRDSFLLKMDEEDFDEVLKVNLKGTFLVVQNSAKLLVEHNLPGSIITISSIIGKVGNMGQTNYSASKSGVEMLTKCAAMELGKFGIRCNTILPGFIETPMVETVPEKLKEMFRKRTALGRLGDPNEISDVILFLASDNSSFVNGASIEVTGGGF